MRWSGCPGPAAGAVERHTLQHSRSKEPLYVNGLEVEGVWPASFLPPGGGISITLQSHVDTLCFGFIGAPEKTGDLWPLVGYMNDALEELERAIAGAELDQPLEDQATVAADPMDYRAAEEYPAPTGGEPTPKDPTTFPKA
jgi:WS/DGAT C-terminal domain